MNRHDVILSIWLVVLFCLLPFFVLNSKKAVVTDTVIVKVDGETVKYIDFSMDSVTKIETPYGNNTVCVENKSVYVSESDCYGKDCVNYGKISDTNGHIICLPHHLVVYIQGENSDMDAVSY